ncbi:uncharacterized protein C5L36_0A04950 [Pichia kudriavzevii]|uniref:Biotin biosynthesis bifunctional protein BioCD n=2 Tax=Pichia kudriavzevii TaxID=4909 RepID=A0A1V2LS38_PICKU|nr:uncharacterized protein C5L36_0A04950 [Pichia kudriavzevii]AWU73898.1 hypothetical protein C5L36_0A04950 [Pichia kudriavzevii]MDC6274444.1 dethiobiotin synthase [Lacticaseibacillus paracasei]ONH76695.1 Biotin biosynthesis bifunctional protein BioCD [Pichia kudriavzevii]
MKMQPIFITGTDTDVGKTFISALLVKRWGADYWKPVQTGLNEDIGDTATVTQMLQASGGIPSNTIIFDPALKYQNPLSPWRCTILENKEEIDITKLNLPPTTNTIIVEGAGGVLVPFTKDKFTTDVIHHLNTPVILVARSKLGTLNHTLLSLEVMKARGNNVVGVILNGEIDDDNLKALEALGARIIAQIPHTSKIEDVLHLIPPLEEVLQ